MISVGDALTQLFALVDPLNTETVPLTNCAGRILAADVRATRDQPPFAASAMDGYAVADSTAAIGTTFKVIGEAAAGHGFDTPVADGQAVRIFTGAPLPTGAHRVIIQEDVERHDTTITVTGDVGASTHIRPSGGDFVAGQTITAPRVITASDVALFAAMNVPFVTASRQPDIAILATGDELVSPGETPAADQIIASNSYGLKALFEANGATVRVLPIARDTEAALKTAFDLAQGADVLVTIGGASVGDHDLVGKVAQDYGLDRSFYKVRMRPGKPLMAGRMGEMAMIGLPGNPVSAMVCGTVFVIPMIRKMLGLGASPLPRKTARLAQPIAKNGPREHYMRAKLDADGIRIFDRQDSSLLTVLSDANVLVIRAPNDPQRDAGDRVDYITI